MKNAHKILLFFGCFLSVCIAVTIWFPKEPQKHGKAQLKIGAGDDLSGVLMRETAAGLEESYGSIHELERSSFQDCCSNAAQWALNAEEINLGFFCNHIAKHTVEQNSEVIIYGPAIMNAELICYEKSWEEVKRVGIVQGREQLKQLSQKTFPQIDQYSEITQKGILYTLADDQIDAAVLDVTKAAQVPEYQAKPLSETDYISYVLVVEKAFIKTAAFSDFLESYNKAVHDLNQEEHLAQVLGVSQEWMADKPVKFLPLDNNKE